MRAGWMVLFAVQYHLQDEMHWCHNVHGCMLFECEGMKGWMSTMLVYCAGQCSKPPVKIQPQCCCLQSQSRID